MRKSGQKVGGCLFLCLVIFLLIPNTVSADTYGYRTLTPIAKAREAFDPQETPLVTVDYQKEIEIESLLENFLTLSDAWSYLYTYRAEGEKLLKDSWLAFREDASYMKWKENHWPRSVSLLVAWQENETYSYSGIYAIFNVDYESGESQIEWHFNEWQRVHYNIYVLRDWFVNKFIPAVARAPRGEHEYDFLLSVLRTGDKDGQYEIRVRLWSGDWKLPIAALLVIVGWRVRKSRK